MSPPDPLGASLAIEAEREVPAAVATLAAEIAAHHGGASAVVYYGSTLRTGRLAGEMLDFYLLIDSYRDAYRSRVLAEANRSVPPNVFPISFGGLVAKYAVLSTADVMRLVRADAPDVSVWARFCQPIRIAWSRDPAAGERVVSATRAAVLTFLRSAAPMECTGEPLAIWRAGLTLTYGAELRAERGDRGDSVVGHDPDRYRRLALLGAQALGWSVTDGRIAHRWSPDERRSEAALWRRRRWRGKAMTLLRLAKASATYGGGIDYLADKIERHSGQPVRLRPWQRRLPILGAVWLLPALIRSGAVR